MPVVLHEMRPVRMTEAHQTGRPRRARLLQFVPLRRLPTHNAVGAAARGDAARSARSIMRAPTRTRCRPAARSRSIATAFPQAVDAALVAHPLIALERGEIAGLPPADWDSVIVATGPLTSPALAEAIAR